MSVEVSSVISHWHCMTQLIKYSALLSWKKARL